MLRLLVMGTSGDVRGQLQALRDMGAFPPDTDLEAVVVDLELEGPVKDPTRMTADELTVELREITKKLLGYGARAPKELMLFVKNMLFLDSATGALAPELDILGEIAHVYTYFSEHYGERIAQDLGLDPSVPVTLDLASVRASFGIADPIDELTYEDVRRRREIIRRRMSERRDRPGYGGASGTRPVA